MACRDGCLLFVTDKAAQRNVVFFGYAAPRCESQALFCALQQSFCAAHKKSLTVRFGLGYALRRLSG